METQIAKCLTAQEMHSFLSEYVWPLGGVGPTEIKLEQAEETGVWYFLYAYSVPVKEEGSIG